MKEQLNTLNQFENGVFQIEREGKIITLTQDEIYRFRYLEMSLVGKNCLDTYLDIADNDEIKIIEKIRRDEKYVITLKRIYLKLCIMIVEIQKQNSYRNTYKNKRKVLAMNNLKSIKMSI